MNHNYGRMLHQVEMKFEKWDFVICDEFGYISFDKAGAELLFNHLSTRAGRKSTIITANSGFDRWEKIFGDPALTAALVDRITHISHLVNMNGESYRLRETKELWGEMKKKNEQNPFTFKNLFLGYPKNKFLLPMVAVYKHVDIFATNCEWMKTENNILATQLTAKGERNFYYLLFVVVWTYIWLRAIFTQMTHDETANFLRFVQSGDFLPYSIDTSATNHLLNSFLAWILYSLFGAEPLALRLGNVLSFPVYFYFLVKLGTLISKPNLRISFVIVLTLTHNLIEFFAMSRGYGHSMAFLLAALWFLLRSFNTISPKNYFFTLLFAILALTANLTLLNSVLLIILFLILRLVIQQKFNFFFVWKHWLLIVFLGIVPVIFYTSYLFYLKEMGDLYYGLTTGFWQVTVKTLIKTMLDPGCYTIEIFVGIYFTFIVLFGIFFFFKNFTAEHLFNQHQLFFFLLIGSIAGAILLKYIFVVNYPEDRTGLYFVVYFVGAIFFISDSISKHFRFKKIYILVIPLLFVPLHFFFNMNLSHNSFENHKIPDRFYQRVLDDYTQDEVPPTVGGYMGRVLRWAFLNYKHGSLLGKVQWNIFPNTIEDYQIVDSQNLDRWKEKYDVLDYYDQSGFYLLKRKVPAAQKLIFAKTGISSQGEINHDYYRFFIIDADSLADSDVQIVFDFHFETRAKPFVGWLVANSLDANNQQIGYEYFPLEWLDKKWENETGRVLNSMIIHVPDNIHQLNFYIWNKKKVPFSVAEGQVKVMKYE